jgi:hypothetical protein
MATILEFKSAPRPAAASMLSACQAASAEIVLFPGVQYERHASDSAADAAKSRRHREEPELED